MVSIIDFGYYILYLKKGLHLSLNPLNSSVTYFSRDQGKWTTCSI